MHKLPLLPAAAVVLLLTVPAICAATEYKVIGLGVRGSGAAVNAGGEVVGWYDTQAGPEHAFSYLSGQFTDLGTMGYSYSSAAAVNSAGKIVGSAFTNAPHGFLFESGSMSDIGTLGGATEALGINAGGAIVGRTVINGADRAFIDVNGVMTDLGTLGGAQSQALAINLAGLVAGWANVGSTGRTHAAVFHDGIADDLLTLGGSDSTAYAINDSGFVVGKADTENNAATHAFLYDGAHPMIDLGSLGGDRSEAMAINSAGKIVGDSYTTDDADRHAFLYENGAMSDLNALLEPSSSNWTLYFANGINDSGWIVGDGRNPQGQSEAFLAIPVPEPATTFVWGLSVLSLRRRRRVAR